MLFIGKKVVFFRFGCLSFVTTEGSVSIAAFPIAFLTLTCSIVLVLHQRYPASYIILLN